MPFDGRVQNASFYLFITSDLDQEFRAGSQRQNRNGPRNLDSAVSEIFLRFQAANVRPAKSKYTASGVRRSSAL